MTSRANSGSSVTIEPTRAALAEGGQLDDILRAAIADQRGDRAERLDLVELGPPSVACKPRPVQADARDRNWTPKANGPLGVVTNRPC
jgi:hypothetical protein